MYSYHQLVNKQIDLAITKLNQIDISNIKNPMVVFDIDSTLLTQRGLIRPVFNFYNLVKEKGINIGIITARTSDGMDYTVNQLHSLGIDGYVQLYFRKRDAMNPTITKEQCRKELHEKGYNVIMSVGDMKWDMGNYGGVGILLPTFI